MIELLRRSPLWGQPPLAAAVAVLVPLAVATVLVAVVVDFVKYGRRERTLVAGGRSLVETGTMTAFFVVYYLVVRFRALEVAVGGPVRTVAAVVGLGLVVAGAAFNIAGRVTLRSAWSNQIEVCEGQELISRGPYAMVRHPLYASLIWMFVGGSLVYANPLSLALTLAVFVPMMYVRARKEDAVLGDSFGESFDTYRRRTGMFLPRIRRQ